MGGEAVDRPGMRNESMQFYGDERERESTRAHTRTKRERERASHRSLLAGDESGVKSLLIRG